MADLVVLAKAAQEIARAHKDRTGTRSPDQRGFFSEVRIEAGNGGLPACLTKPQFSIQSISPAVPGAKMAGFKNRKSLLDSLLQNSFGIDPQVRRLRFHGTTQKKNPSWNLPP
jgi:hypothetical protein